MSFIVRAVAGCAAYFLLQLALLFSPGSLGSAQAQVIACNGTASLDDIRTLLFDASAGTCNIFSGGATLQDVGDLTVSSQTFGGVLVNDSITSSRGTGGASTDTGHLVCDLGAGDLGVGICFRRPVSNGDNLVAIEWDVSGVTHRLEATVFYDVGQDEVNFTSAQICIGSGPGCASAATGPSASDKSTIIAGLQQSLNAATPGLLESLPLGPNIVPSTGGETGLSFAPQGDNSNTTAKSHYGIGFAPDTMSASGGSGFDFNVNLQQMATHMARTKAGKTDGVTAYAPGETLPSPQSRWLTSLSGRYVDFDDGQSGADRSGNMWLVTSALGYRLNDNTTAGVLTRYRSGNVESTAAAAELHSTLYGGGAFFSSTGPGGVRLSGAALYEFGTNDVTISGDSGSFDSSAFTVEGKIDKRFTSETTKHWLEPAVNILYLQSDSDDYTDSAGVRVEGQSQTLGRLTFGPKIGTTITASNASGDQTIYSPYASLKGIWDFDHPDDLTTSSGVTFTSAETGLTLAGGVDIALADGLNMHISGDWITYNTKLQVWSVSSGMEASFAALGLGTKIPGLVALNFTGNTEAAQTEAKVKIPLQ